MALESDCKYPCEAPFHVQGCDGKGVTRDHFTPRSIAKELNWTDKEIGSPMNIQHLSVPCHKAKDGTTPSRLYLLRGQLQGRNVGFEQHQMEIKERSDGKYVDFRAIVEEPRRKKKKR